MTTKQDEALAKAYELVAADQQAKRDAYETEVAESQAKHKAELDFIKGCTPEQVGMAGLTIGPTTTHDVVYKRLRAVVGSD